MLDVLKFIFSSFWIWLGSFLLLALVLKHGIALVAVVVRTLQSRPAASDPKDTK
jgi:hypothetical protein